MSSVVARPEAILAACGSVWLTAAGARGYQPGVLESRSTRLSSSSPRSWAEVTEVDCPNFDHAMAAYYLICRRRCRATWRASTRCGLGCASATTARTAEEVMALTRAADSARKPKRRIMIGTYALSQGYYDAYYNQAQKVRTLIARDLDRAYESVDVLVSPATPTTAFRLGRRSTTRWAMYLFDSVHAAAELWRALRHAGAARCRPTTGCRSACRSWRPRWPMTGSTGSAPRTRPRGVRCRAPQSRRGSACGSRC